MRFQAQDQIPMPLDQAVLDFQPLGIVETAEGPRQRVVLVAARRDMVERVLAAVRAAGLRPEGIDLSAFAMIRALHRDAAARAAEHGPLPLRRRPDEPRGRARARLPLHPRRAAAASRRSPSSSPSAGA